MSWKEEFERRILAVCTNEVGATFVDVVSESESWAYSEYTGGTDKWLEVEWRSPSNDNRVQTARFESMAELLTAMDAVP